MKTLITLISLVFSVHASATAIHFRCAPDVTSGLRQFSALGSVEVNDKNEATGDISITLSAVLPSSVIMNSESVQVAGTAQYFAAGVYGVNAITNLSLSTEKSDTHVSLNLGLKGPASSTLLVNGSQYKSECVQGQ
jgi:hypothetical protein